MSNAKIREALDRMEGWLSVPSREMDIAELTEWNETYLSAVAGAERGPEWPDLVVRAHALGERLNARMASVIRERDALKTELESFARGNRALKGYGTHAR
ncbi:MAG: hypothetical protein A3J24_04690 [Deltaproteobacteria bacterium RIFCSPLOWO2_02_FULL_53_8]|nr:MAG: hypothetical protein A3J24_04690 [Deltaproteobacteria bacterium RIFCSPLOWO2_02_FULL_53_8]